MIRKPVKGKKTTLKIYKTDGFYPVACLVDVSIWINEQIDDVSTPDSGRYPVLKPAGYSPWGVDIESVTVLQDVNDTLWFTWEFFLELVRTSGVNAQVVLTDIAGNEKIYQGFVFVKNVRISGNANDWSKSTVQLVGSGALQFDGNITPNTPKVIRIPWTATAEQTVFQDNRLIGKTVTDIKHVSSEGDDKYEPIDAGTPTDRQVKLDNVTGSLEFLNGRDAGAYVYALIE